MHLIPWLGSLFQGLIGFFLEFMTKRFAVLAAIVTSFLALLGILTTAFQSMINGLQATVPTGAFLFGLGLLPDNTETAISTYIAARIAAMVYSYRLQMLDYNSKVLLVR